DVGTLLDRARLAEKSWWPSSWWRRRPVMRTLRGVARDGKAPPKEQLIELLTRARMLRERQDRLDASSEKARALLGRYWNDGEAEWKSIASVRDWAADLRSIALRTAGDDFARSAELRQHWAQLAREGRELLGPTGAIGREFLAFDKAFDEYEAAKASVVDLL